MEKIEFKVIGYKMTQCIAKKSKDGKSSFVEMPDYWIGKNVIIILTEQ